LFRSGRSPIPARAGGEGAHPDGPNNAKRVKATAGNADLKKHQELQVLGRWGDAGCHEPGR